MPISAPEKVATSPNATRSDSWICPSGSIKSPQNNNTRPPKLRTEAVMSCKFTFIFLLFFEIECKYAHIFGGFANFLPKSFPTHHQAYFRKASILLSETGCPWISSKRSMRVSRCLMGMICPARWLSRSWISCVVMMLVF